MAKTVRALITVADDFGDGRPDNTLPGGGGGHPWLPGHGGGGDRPGNELPGGPTHPWLPGHGGGDRPDNALPGYGRPDNSLPVAPGRPANPIVLPPGLIDPGFGNRPPTDPGYGRPGGGRPDHDLPGKPGRPERPDNSLPGSGARPDNDLPHAPARPDNSLPGSGGRPDNSLPGGVPPGLGNGNFPIYIPPGSIAPGTPTLPIVLPTYLPEGSVLVIPVSGDNMAQPKDAAPEGQQLAVLWYGPGTVPTIAYVSQTPTPTPKK